MAKVCHVTSAHRRYDVRIFQKECVSLAKEGFATVLLVNDNEGGEEKDGVQIISTGFTPKSRVQRALKTNGYLKNKLKYINADLYHFHDPELLPLALRLKKQGKFVIFDSHEDYPAQIKVKHYIPYPLRLMVAAAYRAVETYVCKRIDAVILPSTVQGENPFDGRCKQCVLVNNYPLISRVKRQKTSGEVQKTMSVCYTGGLTSARGIDTLISACYKAHCSLILAGLFSPISFGVEMQQKEEYTCVDYRGQIPHDEVFYIYEEASVGMAVVKNVGQYHKADNLWTKVYEYMQMKLPVILSKTPYTTKLVAQHPFAILVNPEDVEEISDAIIYLRSHPEEAAKMGAAGYALINEEFNWEKEVEKLIELYYKILK